MNTPIIVAYGGGVNSTAMIVEMVRRKTDFPLGVMFADTGGERPETYAAVKAVSAWIQKHGWNPILTVRNAGATIEEDCATRSTLPSIAFGFKSCSDRWKARPVNRWIKDNLHGEPYVKAIGFDAGEDRRVRASTDKGCTNWFPLVEWGLHREDCVDICRSEGLPIAKSSCFFCPSMKKHEILQLQEEHPDLMERALAMEARSQSGLDSVKGLGRRFAWADFLKANAEQQQLFKQEQSDIPCGCYDGDSD